MLPVSGPACLIQATEYYLMIDKADRNSQVFPDRMFFLSAVLYIWASEPSGLETVGECAKRSALSYLRT